MIDTRTSRPPRDPEAMKRRAAWRHWWVTATVLGLALVVIAVTLSGVRPGLWELGLIGTGLTAGLVSAVVNRPRPFIDIPGPVAEERERRAQAKAVRRGYGVEPPAQRNAVETVRREWYTVGVQCGVVATVAANWAVQSTRSDAGVVELALEILGYLLLLGAVVATAYYRRVLRRLDSLEDSRLSDAPDH